AVQWVGSGNGCWAKGGNARQSARLPGKGGEAAMHTYQWPRTRPAPTNKRPLACTKSRFRGGVGEGLASRLEPAQAGTPTPMPPPGDRRLEFLEGRLVQLVFSDLGRHAPP